MKIKGLIILTAVIALMLGSCGNSALKNAKLKTKEDSLSYAFGIVNYNALTQDSLILNPVLVAKAMMDVEIEDLDYWMNRGMRELRDEVLRRGTFTF